MAYAEAFIEEFGVGTYLRDAARGQGPSHSNLCGGVNNSLLECAKRLLSSRQRIAKIAPRGLFRDSAWDMMLELFISSEQNTTIYIKQLMLVSGETAASAMRRIDRLAAANFLERIPDIFDHRRVVVKLTQRGKEAMKIMLNDLDSASCA
ncbi:MarR family transcriptional regulator [Novosphingobium sp. 9]|uniref:MarR family transcriptional regulator n=1 Tax=Novosphingobium sp. 9 TaxID=2025349 RepID=UPI0021B66AB2|nr:MarR family transcriptional regulator [Novosphingobium sp. 9]